MNKEPKQTELNISIDNEPPEAWDAAWKASYKSKAAADAVEGLKLAKALGTYDIVQRPAHYNAGDIECIDGIKAMLTEQEFIGYLRGNSLKYRWRYPYKNGIEDLLKAEWYETRLLGVLRGDGQ
jgi:hypothetical protein